MREALAMRLDLKESRVAVRIRIKMVMVMMVVVMRMMMMRIFEDPIASALTRITLEDWILHSYKPFLVDVFCPS